MAKVVTFSQVNPQAAAIDIGQQKIVVSTDGLTAKTYETFTQSYHQLLADLKAKHIECVCMEATGVYWIVLYAMLEEAGFGVCLVNPKEVKQVKGRKTDVADCCWIWKVFSAGLVRQSYVPAGLLKDIRLLLREREDLIGQSGMQVNKMHRALELMNLKIGSVLSQLQGKSGLALIDAILGGQPDPQALLALCDVRIRKTKATELVLALEGRYSPTALFLLQRARQHWQHCEDQLGLIDAQVATLVAKLSADRPQVECSQSPKPPRHHPPQIKELTPQLARINGVDATSLPGLNSYTLLRLLGEVGHDLSRFPTVKHFVSWCQLAPMPHQSGKYRRSAGQKPTSPAGQIFRQAAQSLLASKQPALGAYVRRLKGRLDSRTAIKAGARKIAQLFYWLLTKGEAYVERGVVHYQQQQENREKAALKKLAHKHQFQLLPLPPV